MKKKIGTVMEEHLLWEAKKAALEKKRRLSWIFEEALSEYLEKRKRDRTKKRIAAKTRGIIKLSPDKLREIMDEPGIHEV